MKEMIKKYTPIIIGKYLQFLFFFNKNKALHRAYIFFSTPRDGAVLEDQEYFLEENEDEVIQTGDHYIQTYRWANEGETVLLVHGWESNTHRWKTLIQKLHLQGYNVVAFDAPAQGNSSGKILNVPLYAECLQKIIESYRPNYLVSHSVGAMTTIFNQYLYPEPEIQKLVILAPPSELGRIMSDYQNILKLPSKFMTALDFYFKDKFGYTFEEFSTAKFAKKLSVKGILIHDRHDDIAPYEEGVSVANNWKKGKLITTENFGHSLFFDQADQMIINYLND